MPKSLFFPMVVLLGLLTLAICNWAYNAGIETGKASQIIDDRINEAMDRAKQWKYDGVVPPTINWGWGK